MDIDKVNVDEMLQVMEEVFTPDIIELKDHASATIYHAGQTIVTGVRIARNASEVIKTLFDEDPNN